MIFRYIWKRRACSKPPTRCTWRLHEISTIAGMLSRSAIWSKEVNQTNKNPAEVVQSPTALASRFSKYLELQKLHPRIRYEVLWLMFSTHLKHTSGRFISTSMGWNMMEQHAAHEKHPIQSTSISLFFLIRELAIILWLLYPRVTHHHSMVDPIITVKEP